MGAGILPTAIHQGKLYFLFGKENYNEKSAPGFSDFGGGQDGNENYLEAAIRESVEESTGFLGSIEDMTKLIKKYGTYNIDLPTQNKEKMYRMHLIPYRYDPSLPFYYNNNAKFLHQKLDPKLIKESKIFEKEEIQWFCIDDLKKNKSKFRHFFQPNIDTLLEQQRDIYAFINKNKRTNKTTRKTKHKIIGGISERRRNINNKRTKTKMSIRTSKRKSSNLINPECCICNNSTTERKSLVPLLCLNKHGYNAHRICKKCWWDSFATEGTTHTCPGCIKQKPLTAIKSNRKSTAKLSTIIDLTEDD